MVLIVKLLTVALVGGEVVGWHDDGLAGESVAEALRQERCLPASVRGPVDFWALARFISARLVRGWSFVEMFGIVFPFCL